MSVSLAPLSIITATASMLMLVGDMLVIRLSVWHVLQMSSSCCPAGMPSTVAPPPWLSRMAVLGVPPAYQLSTDGLKGAEDHMMFVTGSEDEGDEAEGQNGADRSSNSEASANSQGQQDPADADFVPLDGEAAQQQEGSRQQQAHKQQQEGSLQQPVASHRRCTQQFPGINAPLPDGADAAAWQAELDRASYASRMMGIAA